jgi:hypothetical protein
MKNFSRSFAVLALTLAAAISCLAAEPFGFHYGETEAQITASVGSSHVKHGDLPGKLVLDTAPKPHHAFESYILFVSPTKGLLKILAIGEDIKTNTHGDQVREKLEEIATALNGTYGSSKHIDGLKAGSTWTEPGDWMTSVLRLDRKVFYFWSNPTTKAQHLEEVAVDVVALASDKGYLLLVYEFEGWGEYVDQMNAQRDSVL